MPQSGSASICGVQSPPPIEDELQRLLIRIAHLDLTGKVSDISSTMKSHGGYGDVFTGYCSVASSGEDKDTKVAIKRLRVYASTDEFFKKKLIKELYIWTKLDHSYILPLRGFFFNDDNYPCLVSTWVENGTIFAYLESHTNCDFRKMVLHIAEGINYLHECGIIHSDIKPDNILVSSSGEPRICDFGISHMLVTSGTFDVNSGIGNPQGTCRYMSIELLTVTPAQDQQFESDTCIYSEASDVWAFGMTIFALLTMKAPYFHIRSEFRVISAIVSGELPKLPEEYSTAWSEIYKSLWQLCMRCWTRLPLERPSMIEIISSLETFSIPQQETLSTPQQETSTDYSLEQKVSITTRDGTTVQSPRGGGCGSDPSTLCTDRYLPTSPPQMHPPESASDSAGFLPSGYVSDSARSDDESSSLAISVPGSTNGSTEALTQMDLSAYEKCAQDLETHHEESLESKMPERIEAIRESFKAVRGYFKNLQAEFDKETISRYYARWGELDKTFEGIVLETNRLASKGARHIKDFCNFIGNNDGTIEEKIRELKRFQNDLFSEQTSLFGSESKNLYEPTNKINSLYRGVQSFGFEIATSEYPGKQAAIKEIESLERKLERMKFKVFDKRNSDGSVTGLRSGVTAILSLSGGDKEALNNSVEDSLKRPSHNQEYENLEAPNTHRKSSFTDTRQTMRKKGELAKKDMKMRDEVWGKLTQDCGEQINQITDQLLAISSLWTALCSDIVELDTPLGLIAKKDMHENLFYRKLATTQRLYSCLYEILLELTHPKSSGSYSALGMAHIRTTTQRSNAHLADFNVSFERCPSVCT